MKQLFNYNTSNKLGSTLSVSEIEPGMQVEYNDKTFTILQIFQPNNIETTKGIINIPAERTVKLLSVIRIKSTAILSIREVRTGMIVFFRGEKRYITKVSPGWVWITGLPPISRTEEPPTPIRFLGWFQGKLKQLRKGATFQLDGHLYIKGAYKKSIKSYLCAFKDSGEEIYINEQTTVTI